MDLKLFLSQPFDYFNGTRHRWIYVIGSTLFVFIFLLLFQPYGISQETKHPFIPDPVVLLFLLSISASTFLGLSLAQFFLRPLMVRQDISNGTYIWWLLFEALLITLFMFGFSLIVPDLGNDFENELNLSFQLKNYFRCLVILLFPFLGSLIFVLVERMSFEIKELSKQIAHYGKQFSAEQKKQQVDFSDESGNIDFSIGLDRILYLESSNQYVLIYYLERDTIKKHIVRNRMKSIMEQIKGLPLQRCHRSFAVNLLQVSYMSKKSGKEFLAMDTRPTIKIPISKSYLQSIREELVVFL